MEIRDAEAFVMHIPVTGSEIADSTHRISHWGVVGVRIKTVSGLEGYGFTGTHAHLASDMAIARFITDVYAPLLKGENALDHRRIWNRLFHEPAIQWVGRAGISQLALSAIDVALWDLDAKQAGLPLWALLGGDGEKNLGAYNTDVGWLSLPLTNLVEGCRRACQDEGFSGVKLKVGSDDLADDVRRVEAVRHAVGSEVTIAVDANGKLNLPEAVRLSHRLEGFDILWLEEPLWYDDVEAHSQLAQHIRIPIALGEQIYSVEGLSQFMRRDAVQIVQPDVTRIGGITPMLDAITLASKRSLPVAPHAGEMSQVHAHIAFSSESCSLLEYIPWIRESFEEPLTVRDGFVMRPQRPGAGTTPTDEAFRRYVKPL